ncbi:MAG: carbohydrate-binding family 9-like protein [Armatimonadota bacterium]
MRSSTGISFLFTVSFLICFGTVATAQGIATDLPLLSVGQTGTPPVIDGKLDDACYQNCIEAGNFTLVSSNAVAKEQTKAYLCRDAEMLYVGVWCHETILDPVLNQLDRFQATKKTRDADVWADDAIELFIAPGESRSGYYHIVVNALGTIYDSVGMDQPEAINADIAAEGNIGDTEWTVELALPLEDFAGDGVAAGDEWYLNICRAQQAADESSSWSPVGSRGFHSPERFGTLRFVESVSPMQEVQLQQADPTLGRLTVRKPSPGTGLVVNAQCGSQVLVGTDRVTGDGQLLCTTYSTDPDNRCLRIGSAEDRCPGTYSASQKNIFVEGGRDYRFSAHLKIEDAADDAGERLLYITAYDEGGDAVEKYTPLGSIDYSADHWQTVSADWTAPENAVKVMLWIVKWEKSRRATYLIDDITLRPVDSTTNLVKNGSFRSGSEETGWGHTKGVEFVSGYGAGADEIALQYQLANDEPMYRSPVFRHSLQQRQFAIRSQLSRMSVSGPDEITQHPIRELSLVEDTTQPVTLLLSSSDPASIETVTVNLTLPDFCFIIDPKEGRQTVAPQAVARTSGSADGTHTYHLTFGPDVVTAARAANHEIIPVPLFFCVSGSTSAKTAYEIRCHAETDSGETEPETVIPLRILPPLSGARPESLPIEIHMTGKAGKYSGLEKAQWIRTWGLAGYTNARIHYPASDPINRLKWDNGMAVSPYLPWVQHRFPYQEEYLQQHPEHAAVNAAGRQTSCVSVAHVIPEGSPFREYIGEVMARYAQAFPEILQWDFETVINAPTSSGFSEANIALFREHAAIGADVELTPDVVLEEYAEEWTDFRSWENAQMGRIYREAVKEANPDCTFEIYSSYQSERNRTRHGTDWRYLGKECDWVCCGYGRGPWRRMHEVLDGRPYCAGELIYGGDYPLDPLENTLFQRLTDAGAFLTFVEPTLVDGRLFSAVSRASQVAADFEPFFLNYNRRDDLAADENGNTRADVAVLTHDDERLIVVFNNSPSPKNLTMINRDVPGGLTAIDYNTKTNLPDASRIDASVAPWRVGVYALVSPTEGAPEAPAATTTGPVTQHPVLRWSDPAAATHSFDIQISAGGDFAEAVTVSDIPATVAHVPQQLEPGEYSWRVRAVDVSTGASGKWSQPRKIEVGDGPALETTESEKRLVDEDFDACGYWVPMTFEPFVKMERDTEVTHGPGYSLKIEDPYDVSYGYWTNWRNPTGTKLTRVQTGDTITLTSWIKTEGDDVEGGVTVGFIDENGAYITGARKRVSGTHDWQEVSIQAPVPRGAANYRVLLGASGVGTVWHDSLSVNVKGR